MVMRSGCGCEEWAWLSKVGLLVHRDVGVLVRSGIDIGFIVV